jgi:hypothetical protein
VYSPPYGTLCVPVRLRSHVLGLTFGVLLPVLVAHRGPVRHDDARQRAVHPGLKRSTRVDRGSAQRLGSLAEIPDGAPRYCCIFPAGAVGDRAGLKFLAPGRIQSVAFVGGGVTVASDLALVRPAGAMGNVQEGMYGHLLPSVLTAP